MEQEVRQGDSRSRPEELSFPSEFGNLEVGCVGVVDLLVRVRDTEADAEVVLVLLVLAVET